MAPSSKTCDSRASPRPKIGDVLPIAKKMQVNSGADAAIRGRDGARGARAHGLRLAGPARPKAWQPASRAHNFEIKRFHAFLVPRLGPRDANSR